MMEKLKTMDFLGGIIAFNHHNNKTIKTSFGGVLTISSGVIFILLIIGFGQDFFNRTNPSFIKETTNPATYPSWTLSNQNFSIALRLEDPNGIPIVNDSLIYIEMHYFWYEMNDQGVLNNTIYNTLQLVPCTEDMFFPMDGFNQTNLMNFLCANVTGLVVGGYWDANFLGQFDMNTYLCVGGLGNSTPCGSLEDQQNLLANGVFFSVMVQSILINPSNYRSPLQYQLVNDFHTLDISLLKSIYYYNQIYTVSTDFGWIISSWTDVNLLGFYQDTFDVNTIIGGGQYSNMLSTASIYFSKSRESYLRVYSKLQTLCANVGGILQVFLFLGHFIIQYYNEAVLEYELLKTLDIEHITKQHKDIIQNTENLNNNTIIQLPKSNSINSNTNNAQISKIKPQMNSHINLNDSNAKDGLLILGNNLKEPDVSVNNYKIDNDDGKSDLNLNNNSKNIIEGMHSDNVNKKSKSLEDANENPPKPDIVQANKFINELSLNALKAVKSINKYRSTRLNIGNLFGETPNQYFINMLCKIFKKSDTTNIKVKAADFIRDKLAEYFEVTNAVKCQQNVEKMKQILFGENQMHLFT